VFYTLTYIIVVVNNLFIKFLKVKFPYHKKLDTFNLNEDEEILDDASTFREYH
jgi:hypothetical protein